MLSIVPILDDNVDYLHMLQYKTVRSVSLSDSGVGAKSERRERCWYKGGVECDLVKHSMVSAVVHGLEKNLELDSPGNSWLGDDDDRNKREIIYILILVDRSKVCHLC